jgi:NADH-quinone oxidoreductase subunit J
MSAVFFFIAGIGAVAGAIGVVALRNPFYTVLALVGHLLCLAALFLLLHAEFVAATQVIVYAGAVMVLYVFVVAYVGGQDEPLRPAGGPSLKVISVVFGIALFAELAIATLGSGIAAIDDDGAKISTGFGTPEYIGDLLLTRFLFAFEAASFLLLIAAVGAVVLARRRGGLPEEIGPQGTSSGASGPRMEAPSGEVQS